MSNDTPAQALPRAQHVGNGTQTVFRFPFPVFAYGDLEVFLSAELQKSGYLIHGLGSADGGSVRFNDPPAAGASVLLRRTVPTEAPALATQDRPIPPDAAAVIHAYTEGLSEKAYAAQVDGAVPIQTVYALIEEALNAGAEAVLEMHPPYPAEVTPALAQVLGLMNFQTCPVAHLFRAAGHDIPRKVEAEQAFVLHRLIKLALQHGDRWREVAEAELKALPTHPAGAQTQLQDGEG